MIRLGRSGGATQSSMPTSLVYNGAVRMAAGALESRERGTFARFTGLRFARPCKVAFVSFNSQRIRVNSCGQSDGGERRVDDITIHSVQPKRTRLPLNDGREAGAVTHPAVNTAPRRCLHLLANRLIRHDGEQFSPTGLLCVTGSAWCSANKTGSTEIKTE